MSAHVNDFASAVAVYAAVAPSAQTDALTGDAIDMIAADGECFAIQQVGFFDEGPTWTGRIEESADGSTGWTAISGATFTGVTESDNTQVVRFTRTSRYVRYTATVSGGTPDMKLAVLVGEAKKTF
jgi:hypothetical protein